MESMKCKILLFTIIVYIITFFPIAQIIYGQGVINQQLQNTKLKKEVELLDQQINNASFPYQLLQQGLTLIAAAGAAGAAAFFAWQRERRIPPTAEQERILNELVKDWYSRSYLVIFHKIWDEIQVSENDDDLVDHYWQILCHKRFPVDKFPKLKSELESPVQVQYLKKRLHLKDDKDLARRIEAIKNNADVEYYDKIRTILPSVINNAVISTIGDSSDSNKMNYEDIFKGSLKATKRLMIFYRIREDKKVVEILIRAKIHERSKN